MGREDQRLGKKGEFRVFGELLSRDLTVYYPLFDVEGIDCIVKNKQGAHIDIQVKTRTDSKLWDVNDLKPRDDLFIAVCITEPKEQTWIIPSKVFQQVSINTSYKGRKLNRLIMNKKNEKELLEYQGDYGFNSLIDFVPGEDRFTSHTSTQKASKKLQSFTEDHHLQKITEPNVKEAYYQLKENILNQGFTINVQHYYVSLKKGKNVAYINSFSKKKFNIVIMLPYNKAKEIIKSHRIIEPSKGIQKFYNGACFDVYMENNKNLNEVINAINEAANSVNKKPS